MAKSIRSKSKRRFRAIKRDNLFGKVETERVERLAAKQSELKEAAYVKEARIEQEASMDVQSSGPTKIIKTATTPAATSNDDANMQDASNNTERKKTKRAHMTKQQTQRRNKKWKKFFI
ncbi:hypothetical protein BDF19DRAFT_423948 [Syncephalis fuscata]|nr:hypothetical protein BDF19DRAFT_423948 [Syncephalis fuscata]